MFKFRISFSIHLGISKEIIPTSKGHIGNSTYILKKSRQNLQDSYIHKKYHTFHMQAWSDHVMFNTKTMQTRPMWPTNANAYPPKFQNNTNSITINNSALRSHVLPIMTFEFHCKTCNYTSGEACNDNPKNTLLWSSINSSKELVVCVVCPGCEVPLVQCCFCQFNIDATRPDDIERLGKWRSPKGRCKRHMPRHTPPTSNKAGNGHYPWTSRHSQRKEHHLWMSPRWQPSLLQATFQRRTIPISSTWTLVAKISL